MNSYLIPDWPAPSNIKAFQTTRQNGFSTPPYFSFNLATHVEDEKENVEKNREKLQQELNLPDRPFWLEQVHGNQVVCHSGQGIPKADAVFTREMGKVCAILTADCLPILICHREGKEIAAIHAGWRGLLNGVIEQTLESLQYPISEMLAWLGPAIGPEICELNAEIRLDFVQKNTENGGAFFEREKDRWFADLYALARLQMRRMGLNEIYGGNFCTFRDSELFFSHRRDQGRTGRMASLIWIQDEVCDA